MSKVNLADHSARAHAIIAPSSFSRTIECPPSAVASTLYPSQDTVFTREGTLAHEIAEAIASGNVKPESIETLDNGADTEVTAEMVKYGIDYRDYLESIKATGNTLTLLETRLDMSDTIPECFGTADCIQQEANVLRVVDYKYGKGVPVSAEGNAQMRLYAYGALKELEFLCDTDSIEFIEMHIFQPRIDNISMESISRVELLDWISNVAKPAAELAVKGKGKYNAGEHCHWCPHAGKCRELAKVCSEKVKLSNGKTTNVEQLAPWEIADILGSVKVVKAWLDKVEATALQDILDGKEVPGYKVVEGRVGNRTYTNEIEVYDHLIAEGLADEDITKKILLTPADFDKMLGKKEAAKILDGYITRSPGKPTLAPETDKRPAYNPLAQAQEDFK